MFTLFKETVLTKIKYKKLEVVRRLIVIHDKADLKDFHRITSKDFQQLLILSNFMIYLNHSKVD
jgi:hypothetical protein